MADFKKAYDIVMSHEGGYVNDKDDRGGETYKGIARKFHHDWKGWETIDKMKVDKNFPQCLDEISDLQARVKEFYKANFWDVNSLDEIEPQAVGEEMFDTGVNMGDRIASKFFQKALNLLNRNEKDFPDILVDGNIGPGTMAAYKKVRYPKNITKVLNGLQFNRYLQIVKNNPVQEKYFNGWLNRVW